MADFGESIDFSASRFTKLKSKGDKIQFRIIAPPFYDGKHFLKDEEGNWNVVPCPRINEGAECEYCEKFFAAHRKAKKDGLTPEETRKLTDPWKPSISFYFPVINRGTGKFEVFQTTKSVRDAIEAEREMGVEVLTTDFVVLRTEKPGSGYYKVSAVDSAKTEDLTPLEVEEVEKGLETNLEDYIHGRSVEEDDATEDIEL